METTGETLAQDFDRANRQFVQEIRMLDDDTWANTRTVEDWPVGVAAHHVAGWYPWMAEMLDDLAKGRQMPSLGLPLDERNAREAERDAGRSREDAAALAEQGGVRINELLRQLNAEQLAHKTTVGNGVEMTLAELAENMVIKHVEMHLSHIREAVPAQPGGSAIPSAPLDRPVQT